MKAVAALAQTNAQQVSIRVSPEVANEERLVSEVRYVSLGFNPS